MTENVRNNYIIYNPAFQPLRTGREQEGTRPFSDEHLIRETRTLSQMFDTDGARFSPMEADGAPGMPAAGTSQALSGTRSSSAVTDSKPLLNSGTFLKEDRYAGLNPGASGEPPNFRKAGGTTGMAQPTIDEIHTYLDTKLPEGKNRVLWTNLREEPVVYIQGKAYTLRSFDSKGRNMENPGASGKDVEAMEARLKQEILKGARRNEEGKLVIDTYRETGWDSEKKEPIIEKVETPLQESDIKTTREVFDDIKTEYAAKGITVDFNRVPIADEKKPDHKDIDELVEQFKGVDSSTEVVFNCQAGKGRTTSAMTIFEMLDRGEKGDNKLARVAHDDIREQAEPGDYRMTLGIIRRLKSFFQNDQDMVAMMEEQAKAGGANLAVAPKGIEKDPVKARDFFERYYTLFQVYQYSKEQAPGYSQTFSDWAKAGDPSGSRKRELSASLGIRDDGGTACA